MGTTKSLTKTTLLVALLVAGTCAPACAAPPAGPPEIVVDESACAHCSMLISEPAFAGAYRIDGRDRVFDDIGCLLTELREETRGGDAEVWVRDVRNAAWIEAGGATFVAAASLPTPMAGGIVATADPDEVARLVRAHEGTVYAGLEALLASGAGVRHERGVRR